MHPQGYVEASAQNQSVCAFVSSSKPRRAPSTPIRSFTQEGKSRKRSCEELEAPGGMSCKRASLAPVYTSHQGLQGNYVLQPTTNQHQ
jgi:hypothetical protein